MAELFTLKEPVACKPLDEWSSVAVDLLGTQTRIVRGKRWSHRVIEVGEGEPLLLYHGIGGHAETYARNLHNLGKHFHVYAVDALFHGFSSKDGWDPFDWIEIMADGVADLIHALGHRWAHIEGESLGAIVAFEFALRHPEMAGKIILNTGFGSVKLSRDDFVPQPVPAGTNFQELSRASVVTPTHENIRRRMEWLVAEPSRMTDEMIRIRHRLYQFPELYASMQKVYRVDGQPWDWKSHDESVTKEFRPETLVFWTDHNPGDGPDKGKYCADLLPNAQFYNMVDAAHWPQWEKPEEHDQVLIEFISGS